MQTEAWHDDLLMRQWENTAPSDTLEPCRADTGTLLPQLENESVQLIQPKLGWNRGGVAVLNRKVAISLKRGKVGPRLLLMTNRKLRRYVWSSEACLSKDGYS